MELDLGPLGGKAMSKGVFRGGCRLRKSLVSLSANGCICVMPSQLFDLRHPSTGACRLLVGFGTNEARWQSPAAVFTWLNVCKYVCTSVYVPDRKSVV